MAVRVDDAEDRELRTLHRAALTLLHADGEIDRVLLLSYVVWPPPDLRVRFDDGSERRASASTAGHVTLHAHA